MATKNGVDRAKCGLAGAVFLGMVTMADADPPSSYDTATVAKDSEPAAMTEIVVTARKRNENLRDVPESVSVVSSADLAAANLNSVSDLTSVLPTLVLSVGTTNPFVSIRGFGSGNDLSFDQAVGKFIDNVSYGRDQDLRLPLFDTEQVEVLKGPQVLLYGNSTTAGALTISTKKPGNDFEADGAVTYEGFAREVIGEGGVTLPLTSVASLRIAGIYDDLSEGWVRNTLAGGRAPDSIDEAGRVILRVRPTDDLEILLKGEYDRIHVSGTPVEPVAQPTFGPPFPEASRNLVTEYNNDVAPFFMGAYNVMENQTYQADINWRVLGGTVSSTSAYRNMTYTGSTPSSAQVPTLNAWIDQQYGQLSEELRYSGSFAALDATFGVFYQHESLSVYEALDTNLAAIGAPLPPFAFNFGLAEKTNAYSGFLDLTYHFNDQWSLEAGGRYAVTDREASQSFFPGDIVPNKQYNQGAGGYAPNPAYDPLLLGLFGVPPHHYDDLGLHETHLQPQVVAQYKVTPRSQLYAKFVEGYKAGGFDVNYEGVPGDVSPAAAHFLPEKATAYEVGFKGASLADALSYSIALFDEEFKDLQANAFVGASGVTVVTNVGKARSRGVETDFGYTPIRQLRLDASLTYLDAIYVQFPGGVCTRAQAVATPVGCEQDLSGSPTPFSSKWAATLGAEWQQDIGHLVLAEGAQALFRSAYNASTNNEPLLEQAAYGQLDAHVELRPAQGSWSLMLFGRNLTDKHYLTAGDQIPLSTGGLSAISDRGRQLGLRAGVRFR